MQTKVETKLGTEKFRFRAQITSPNQVISPSMFMFIHPLIHPLQLTITKKAQNMHRSQLEKLLKNPNIAQTPHTRSQYPPTITFLLLKPNPHQMCTVSVVLSCRLLFAVCSTGIAILFPSFLLLLSFDHNSFIRPTFTFFLFEKRTKGKTHKLRILFPNAFLCAFLLPKYQSTRKIVSHLSSTQSPSPFQKFVVSANNNDNNFFHVF